MIRHALINRLLHHRTMPRLIRAHHRLTTHGSAVLAAVHVGVESIGAAPRATIVEHMLAPEVEGDEFPGITTPGQSPLTNAIIDLPAVVQPKPLQDESHLAGYKAPITKPVIAQPAQAHMAAANPPHLASVEDMHSILLELRAQKLREDTVPQRPAVDQPQAEQAQPRPLRPFGRRVMHLPGFNPAPEVTNRMPGAPLQPQSNAAQDASPRVVEPNTTREPVSPDTHDDQDAVHQLTVAPATSFTLPIHQLPNQHVPVLDEMAEPQILNHGTESSAASDTEKLEQSHDHASPSLAAQLAEASADPVTQAEPSSMPQPSTSVEAVTPLDDAPHRHTARAGEQQAEPSNVVVQEAHLAAQPRLPFVGVENNAMFAPTVSIPPAENGELTATDPTTAGSTEITITPAAPTVAIPGVMNKGEMPPVVGEQAAPPINRVPNATGIVHAASPAIDTTININVSQHGNMDEMALLALPPPDPLPESTRRFLRPMLGIDPASARIYNGVAANQVAAAHQADAITIGDDIFLATGRAERTPQALGLLAHELAHVARRRVPRFIPALLQPHSSAISDEEPLAQLIEAATEHEAQRYNEAQWRVPSDEAASPHTAALGEALSSHQSPWENLPAPWEALPKWTGAATLQTPEPPAMRPSPVALQVAQPTRAALADDSNVQLASRSRNLAPTTQVRTGAPELTSQTSAHSEPDLDMLARQVYALLKQRLATERRRSGS